MNLNIATDLELFSLVAKANVKAFETLYERHWNGLYRIARHLLEDEDVAKDIVQDMFVDVWEKAKNKDVKNLTAYLHQAIKYRCFMHLRAGNISQKHIARITSIEISNTTEEEMDCQELQLALNGGMASLPEKCRAVFQLSRYESMPNKQIAAHLKISPKTVENQITKALRVLRLSVDKIAIVFLTLILDC